MSQSRVKIRRRKKKATKSNAVKARIKFKVHVSGSSLCYFSTKMMCIETASTSTASNLSNKEVNKV